MKIKRSKDWWIARARAEGEDPILAGLPEAPSQAAFEEADSLIERCGLSPAWRCEIAGAFQAAVNGAVSDRDMEWWEAVILVDNVAPTPEGGKHWQAVLGQHIEEETRKEEAAVWLATVRGERDFQSDGRVKAVADMRAALLKRVYALLCIGCQLESPTFREPGEDPRSAPWHALRKSHHYSNDRPCQSWPVRRVLSMAEL